MKSRKSQDVAVNIDSARADIDTAVRKRR
jgi:hypothetical protein